ncbi:Rap1a/Tai family immunity protein [Kiloniella laminariae]|uniref:Rap1a/Tai family immunity protein n=1 Tax=Kiloniella laminariae TaxID=454162 RepID=A0ABT4LFB7_9PROT|nr:Rap1a/Tai family immunity protein [Kiloniella laminariae]MCZ4279787.1 Rap1a/Tai family immunity protein [Kiloniella laminariae]
MRKLPFLSSVIVTVALTLLSPMAEAKPLSARVLNQYCHDTPGKDLSTLLRSYCAGYILAIRDQKEQDGEVCSYGSYPIGLEEKLNSHLARTPKDNNAPAMDIVGALLKEIYPCDW